MAQNYYYHETRVPKKHYKEKLSVAVEEMIESSVEMNLIATYYRTLEELKKQNGKWFFQALLCLEVGVKPSTIKPSEYQALELTYAKFAQIKKAKAMASDWLDTFESIEKNGAFYTIQSEEKDNE